MNQMQSIPEDSVLSDQSPTFDRSNQPSNLLHRRAGSKGYSNPSLDALVFDDFSESSEHPPDPGCLSSGAVVHNPFVNRSDLEALRNDISNNGAAIVKRCELTLAQLGEEIQKLRREMPGAEVLLELVEQLTASWETPGDRADQNVEGGSSRSSESTKGQKLTASLETTGESADKNVEGGSSKSEASGGQMRSVVSYFNETFQQASEGEAPTSQTAAADQAQQRSVRADDATNARCSCILM